MSILDQARELGVEISNWCSDLYIPVTQETVKLINAYEFKQNVTTFRDETNGVLSFEIPFAYTDYYNKKS